MHHCLFDTVCISTHFVAMDLVGALWIITDHESSVLYCVQDHMEHLLEVDHIHCKDTAEQKVSHTN